MIGRNVVTATACAVALAGAAPSAEARDIYHGVTLLDPQAETATPDSYIVVENGRIAAVGQGLPADIEDANLHDFSGLWALPGLFDTHAHITLGPLSAGIEDGAPYIRTNPSEDIIAHNARMLLSFGVTTIRNPGGPTALNRAYSQRVAAGELTGPEMVWAGEIIDRGPLAIGNLVELVGPNRGPAPIVAEQARAGAHYAKLYAGLHEADVAEGIVAAHAHGMRAIGHLSDLSWTRAAELGIDAIVHMIPGSPDLLPEDRRAAYRASRRPGTYQFFEWYEAADLDGPEVRAMIAALARHEVHVDATLVAFQPAFFGNDEALLARDREYDHPDMVANWRSGFRFDAGWQPEDHARAQAVWPLMLRLTRMMHEGGVPMTIGTDLANPFIAPGISVAREMALYQQAGIPAWAVLRMATSDAARILGIAERTGALRPGLEADILFIAADPRPDLNRVADTRWVVADGVLLSPRHLRESEQEEGR